MQFCVHYFHHEKYQDKWESYTVTKLNNFAAPTNNSHQHQQQDFGLSR